MQKKKQLITWLFICIMALTTILMPVKTKAEILKGGYDTLNAKNFYETLDKNYLDALFENNNIYFATRGYLATSYSVRSSYPTWRSIGWTLNVSNGAGSMEIEVDSRNGKYLKPIDEAAVIAGGYIYELYALCYDDIVDLCTAQNPTLAKEIFAKPVVYMNLNAIITIAKDGIQQGFILSENGKGEIETDGEIYRLKEESQFEDMMDTYGFSENSRDSLENSYRNVGANVPNNSLIIKYYADIANPTSSTSAIVNSSKYSLNSDKLINGATTNMYQLQTVKLYTANAFGLSKPGYHLDANNMWKTERGYYLSTTKEYHAVDIESAVKNDLAEASLIANWIANTYEVHYDANGGVGSMKSQTKTFDKDEFYPSTRTFTKEGHEFVCWQLCKMVNNKLTPIELTPSMVTDSSKANKSGYIYSDTQLKNLSTANNDKVYLKAIWKASEYQITLDPQIPAGKVSETAYTPVLYQLYATRFTLESKGLINATSVTLPTLTGYNFMGYYDGSNYKDLSPMIYANPLDKTVGLFSFPKGNMQFTSHVTLLGAWEPVKVPITLNADTESSGTAATPATQTVTAVYDKDMPSATLPVKNGYVFKGFYTGTKGSGICYYNNLMISERTSDFLAPATLYAHWVDEVKPTVAIEMESSTWTNSNDNVAMGHTDDGYKIIVHAKDNGSGISKVELYREENGSFGTTPVHTSTGYGAKDFYTFFTQWEEGATRFKAIAYDVYGNVSDEYFATCYYDKSSPIVYEDESSYDISDLANIKATIEATDNRVESTTRILNNRA